MKLQIGHWELTFRRLHHPKGLTLKSSQIFTTFSWDMARTNLPQPPNHDPNGASSKHEFMRTSCKKCASFKLGEQNSNCRCNCGKWIRNGSKMNQKWIKNGSKWFCSCSCHQKRCHASSICVGIGDGAGGAGLETCQRIASMIPASSPSRKSQISKEIQWNTVGATLG